MCIKLVIKKDTQACHELGVGPFGTCQYFSNFLKKSFPKQIYVGVGEVGREFEIWRESDLKS